MKKVRRIAKAKVSAGQKKEMELRFFSDFICGYCAGF